MPGTAKKLNLYLSGATKDEPLLREIVTEVGQRIPQQASQQFFDKWSRIYDFNRGQKAGDRITVIGIDADPGSDGLSRDDKMTQNFKAYVDEHGLQNAKFYGLFGFFHALQESSAGRKTPMAKSLKQSGFKVVSMVSYTLDSEMYMPKNPQFPTPKNERFGLMNGDGPFVLVKGINDMKQASVENRNTLFKLDGSNSTFRHSQNLISIKGRVIGENFVPLPGKRTTDYFQYAFLVRNSEALVKLQK